MLRCLVGFSFLSALILPACASTTECTLIGCGDVYEIRFTGASGKPGLYEVDVVADGVASSCQVTLPWTCDVTPMCSAANLPWRMNLSGCALNADQQTLGGITFPSQGSVPSRGPLSIEFVVRRDGMIVGQGSTRPQYVESYPNGPACGPPCRSAPPSETTIAP